MFRCSVCFDAITILFSLPYLWRIVWSQEAWFLPLCLSLLRLFCLLGFFCVSDTKIFKLFVLVLWKLPWYFDRNCIESVCCFYKDGHSINSFLYTLKYKNLKLFTIPILLLFRLYSLVSPSIFYVTVTYINMNCIFNIVSLFHV